MCIFCVLFAYLSLLFCSYFVLLCYFDVFSCFVVLCISIFVCTSVKLLPPGESPIAVVVVMVVIIFDESLLKTKEAVDNLQRLLQYSQLPDKNFRGILRNIWNFSRYLNLFICSRIFLGTGNDASHNPGWETPLGNNRRKHIDVLN